jgi:hypothetical protein
MTRVIGSVFDGMGGEFKVAIKPRRSLYNSEPIRMAARPNSEDGRFVGEEHEQRQQ